MGTRHGSVPEQAPDHPVKVDLAFGFAVRVTTEYALKRVWGDPGKRGRDGGGGDPASRRRQVPVPVQAPLHPLKTESAFGTAVSVNATGAWKSCVQVEGHDMPPQAELHRGPTHWRAGPRRR